MVGIPGTEDPSNQTPPYLDVDLFATDVPLQEAIAANGAGAPAASSVLSAFGRHWGSAAMAEQARLANRNPPELKGEVVDFHPSFHAFMAESTAAGLHTMTWKADGSAAPPPAEVARAARYYMVAQIENGHMCPITMTRASVAALGSAPDRLAQLMPKISARAYDPRFCPWWEKRSITLGMGMTEKQGGTDVRTNTTRAVKAGEGYDITGHKWFMSAPMCDAFLVLAQAPGGLTCFLMPRFRSDGSVNAIHFQRLKDKLGNRSNASSEVEFGGAFAWAVGDEGRGIRTILQMVQLTRLDCAISSAGMMRMALAQATHHARHRVVFGRQLIDQPMMRAVLADMALDVEGALAAVMRLCRAFDLAATNEAEAARARLLTPAIKYWVCKTAPPLIYEAMECLGGNGYVEDSVLPRLYRESPVNAIWEGSGNVMGLDLLRAASREDAHAVLAQLASETSGLAGAVETSRLIERTIASPDAEARARAVAEKLAVLAAAAALNASNPAIAAIFARARLAMPRGANYGASDIDPAQAAPVVARILPPVSMS